MEQTAESKHLFSISLELEMPMTFEQVQNLPQVLFSFFFTFFTPSIDLAGAVLYKKYGVQITYMRIIRLTS